MSNPATILTPSSYEPPRDRERAGGKAARLFELAGRGFRVPPFFCLSTDAFARTIERVPVELLAEVGKLVEMPKRTQREQVPAISSRIRDAICAAGLQPVDRAAVERAAAEMFAPDALVAVRSSVVGEDSATDSFAGQMDTYLYVSRDELPARIVECMASAYSERALAYRLVRGQRVGEVAAGIVVQQMVDSEVAGVAFTLNPTTGNRRETVVSAAFGLGEGVVGGLADADTYYFDEETSRVREADVVDKRSRVVLDRDAGRGTVVAPVPTELSRVPVLEDRRIRAVARLSREIEAMSDGPQDVEWAIASDELYLLQSRPVTTAPTGREIIFDNSNIVENYPGLTLPLTFSFVRESYAETFRAALRMLGVSAETLDEHQSLLDNLVALVDGRLYYNILNWYRLYPLIHLESGLPAWEEALGIDGAIHRPAPIVGWRRIRRLPTTARMRAALLQRLVGLQATIGRYLADVDAAQQAMREIDLGAMDIHDLLDLADTWIRKLRGPYGISVVNDLFAQQLYGLLRTLLESWEIEAPEQLRNDLLSGLAGMHSVAPLHSLLELAREVREKPALRSLFEQGDNELVWRDIEQDPELAEFRARVRTHLEQYGDRTLEELKLETPSISDAPVVLVGMLRNHVMAGEGRSRPERDEVSVRRAAEKRVREKLRLRPIRRGLFEVVLSLTRKTVVNRENLRLARTRTFGLAKRWYRQVGRALARGGLLESEQDVFYLSLDEMKGAVRGHLITRDLKTVVELRKREYEEYAERQPPDRITLNGVVFANEIPEQRVADDDHSGKALRGIGCAGGRVAARAMIVREPRSDLDVNGEILVAPMTDPGWVFLMAAASGLVVEKGSLLSHTAIIGRELGVPTVVGVAAATRRIQSGEMLEIDGSSGHVRLLDREGGN